MTQKLECSMKTRVFLDMCKALDVTETPANWFITKDGFEMVSVDLAHVMMLDLNMKKKQFEHFKLTRNAKIEVEFDTETIRHVIRAAGKNMLGDTVTIELEPRGITKKLDDTKNDTQADDEIKHYDLTLRSGPLVAHFHTETCSKVVIVPKLGNFSTFSLEMKKVFPYIQMLIRLGGKNGSNRIRFAIDENTKTLTLEPTIINNRTRNFDYDIGPLNTGQMYIPKNGEEEPCSLFSLDKLGCVMSSMPTNEFVAGIGLDYPLDIKYNQGAFEVRHLLAPRIEEK